MFVSCGYHINEEMMCGAKFEMATDVGSQVFVSFLVLIEKLRHHLIKVHEETHGLDATKGTFIVFIHCLVLNKNSVKTAVNGISTSVEKVIGRQ